MVRIGYERQSRLVTPLSSNVTSSYSAWLSPISAPPSIWRFNCSGLTTMPGSTAIVYLSTLTLPVLGTTETWHTQAQYVPERNIADTPCPVTLLDPAALAVGLGPDRVCQPDASRTAFNTPISR